MHTRLYIRPSAKPHFSCLVEAPKSIKKAPQNSYNNSTRASETRRAQGAPSWLGARPDPGRHPGPLHDLRELPAGFRV